MAIHANSTPAPIDHRALLSAAAALKTELRVFPNFGENHSAPALPKTGEVKSSLDLATARHARRALEGAVEHGAALLAALGLPQLVDEDFVPLDGAAIGDAIDLAIGTLDALDAPGMDLEDGGDDEPALGWIDGKPVLSDSHDDREAEDEREPDDEADPLDRGEVDGWRRPRRARVHRTVRPDIMARHEAQRLQVIVSPNVVPLFGGRHV